MYVYIQYRLVFLFYFWIRNPAKRQQPAAFIHKREKKRAAILGFFGSLRNAALPHSSLFFFFLLLALSFFICDERRLDEIGHQSISVDCRSTVALAGTSGTFAHLSAWIIHGSSKKKKLSLIVCLDDCKYLLPAARWRFFLSRGPSVLRYLLLFHTWRMGHAIISHSAVGKKSLLLERREFLRPPFLAMIYRLSCWKRKLWKIASVDWQMRSDSCWDFFFSHPLMNPTHTHGGERKKEKIRTQQVVKRCVCVDCRVPTGCCCRRFFRS